MRTIGISVVLLLAIASSASAQTWTQDATGESLVAKMSTAPFPHPARSFQDNRVLIYLPAGFRPSRTPDVIVHYHGHNNEILNSDKGHRYREQLLLSKKNAILLQPQGPLNAADSFGGKHEDPNGLRRFIEEALALLGREGKIPVGSTAGHVLLSGHSGAYRVIAQELDHGGIEVDEVHLHDACYGYVDIFAKWAQTHRLVSMFTKSAGCVTNNVSILNKLKAAGVDVGVDDFDAELASRQAIFVRSDVSHNASTHYRRHWETLLRASVLSDLGVPAPHLAACRTVDATTVQVEWYPVRSSVLRGYRLTQVSNGVTKVHSFDASTTWVRLPANGTTTFQLRAVDDLGRESTPSHVLAARCGGAQRPVLVVDGSSRTTGVMPKGAHDLVSLVARATSDRPVDTCLSESVRDGTVDMGDYTNVLWLCADQSVEDGVLDHVEQSVIARYLEAGGGFCISGGEVGYTLVSGQNGANDAAFLASVLKARYVGDTDPTRRVSGALSSTALPFGGPLGPELVKYPDALAPVTGAKTALAYGSGRGAGVSFEGSFGKSSQRSGLIFLGFPLESMDTDAARAALVGNVLAWLDAVSGRAGR